MPEMTLMWRLGNALLQPLSYVHTNKIAFFGIFHVGIDNDMKNKCEFTLINSLESKITTTAHSLRFSRVQFGI